MNDGTSQAISGLFQENGESIPLEGVDVQGDIGNPLHARDWPGLASAPLTPS